MRRGTTPTITIDLEDFSGEDAEKAVLTLKQEGGVLINKEVEINDGIITCQLTQEDTLRLKKTYPVKLQVKIKLKDGRVKGTEILMCDVHDILNEEII